MRITTIMEEKKTLQEVYDEFLKFKKASGVCERTQKDYQRTIPKFIACSHNTLDFATLCNDVINYFSAIPDTSPSVYNHPYEYLSCMFNYCVRMDYLTKNPITTVGLSKKKDDGNIAAASLEDIKKLLETYNLKEYSGFRQYTMILLMLDTGIRTSEIVQLKNSDFDFEARQIIISKKISKNKKNRIVYVSDETAKMINKIIKIKPVEWGECLFPSRDGKQLNTHALSVDFDRHCKISNIKITPYQLRHSFATYFVKNGGNIFTLQQLMGHSDIRMTKRYTDIDEEAKRIQHEQNTPVNQLIQCSTRVRVIKEK